jgi:monovalent cation:H+ antiporter-2, CPA2 family
MQDTLANTFILLSCAVVTVFLARRFGLPSILAYLAMGMFLGPNGFGVIASTEMVKLLAEFGVVFLMFSIGLEFSLQRLHSMRRLVVGFGTGQMALTALGSAVATWIGYQQGWRAGVAVGLAVAMSSTAIVAKLLTEQLDLHSKSGRQTMGVLLFQDLAVVPCLILLPALAKPAGDLLPSLAHALFQAAIVLGILIWAGQPLMKRLFDIVAPQRSAELLVLTTLWIVFSLAYLTHAAGLSMALGAFIGGMLISETVYRHQVEADIRPFRDLLLGLFFVSVGMLLDVGYVVANLGLLALAVFLLVAGKGIVVLLIASTARNSIDVALRTAAQLAQAGEFGLVLIELAFSLKLIERDVFQLTLTAMLISMFLAPFLIDLAARFGGEFGKHDWERKAKEVHDIAAASLSLRGHVIVCGYGRTGQRIADFLTRENIPFIALDSNPTQTRRPVGLGGRLLFGNGEQPEVLHAAGLDRCRAVVITYPDTRSAERTLRLVRNDVPDLPVIVRTADEHDVPRLKAAGATVVIPEVFEASLMVAAETLIQLGVSGEHAFAQVAAQRAERYAAQPNRAETPAGARKPVAHK